MDSIVKGIGRFKREAYPDREARFKELGSGQAPQLLLVTCSDSRIDPAMVTQTEPGEVFVIRNAGNLVAAHGQGLSGEAATIEYGIEALKIPHLAVCGHTRCGAMAALAEPGSADGLPAVKTWLEAAEGTLERAKSIEGFDDELTRIVAANVLNQLDRIRTHPSVAKAVEAGTLELHGWIYDFEAGEVLVADAEGCFSPICG